MTKASEADKTGGYIGKKMHSVYGNYFSDKGIESILAESIACVSTPDIAPISILGIGSNSGAMEEAIATHLRGQGCEVELTISDIVEEALQDNLNPFTKKVVADNKELPFANSSYDLVLARSVIQYEKDVKDIRTVLREVKRVLKPSGCFVNQAVSFNTHEECDILYKIHEMVNKHMTIQTTDQLLIEYLQIFSETRISEERPPSLQADLNGYFQRYDIKGRRRAEIYEAAHSLIEEVDASLRPHVWSEGSLVRWSVPYKVFVSLKEAKQK